MRLDFLQRRQFNASTQTEDSDVTLTEIDLVSLQEDLKELPAKKRAKIAD